MKMKSLSILLFAILVSVSTANCHKEQMNKTRAAIPWVTVNEEYEEVDMGMKDSFSSLENMLQWSISNSDPENLKGRAEEIQRLSSRELENRQAEMKELLEKMKMPSDAELMKIAIADLNNSSLSTDDHHRALQELLILVEPIDNANDLQKLGGLSSVIQELERREEDLRTAAVWILGKASQNNPHVQNQILELGVLPKLMRMVKSSCPEEAVKALYAVSAVIRNNQEGQRLFYREDGILLLRDIMSNSSMDMKLRRKSLFLLADLVDYSREVSSQSPIFKADQECLKSVVDLLSMPDLDIQEKALMAIKSLLQINNTNAKVFQDICQLEAALEKLGKRLEDLLLDNQWEEFARDIEALREEVIFIFRGKLKPTWSSS